MSRRSRAVLAALLLLLLVPACRHENHLRIEGVTIAETITGTHAALAVFAADLDAVAPAARRVAAHDDAGAIEAVRARRAVAALASHGAATRVDGLSLVELGTRPVAAFVPFTFPVEELTSRQLRDLAAGRMQTWRDAGGPDVPVEVLIREPDTVGRALGGPVAGTPVTEIGAALAERPGRVVLAPGTAAGPLVKPLRVDGLRPHEAGYPVTASWTLITSPGDERAATLGRALAARRDPAPDAEIRLDAVGDIMLGRGVGRAIAARSVRYPFEAVQPLLAGADLRIGNLELPLTERGRPAAKDYVFRAPPSVVEGLAYAGFNVLTLANNHILDYGVEGLLDTLNALDRAGIAYTGAGRTADEAHAPAIISVGGLRVAILSYANTPNDGRSGWVAESTRAGEGTPGVAWGTPDVIRRDVTAARARADVVVVALHAGGEYLAMPNPVQRELAYAAADAGAALVLGAHPHVLQGIELYNRTPIVYSLGNFVFDLDEDDRRQPGLPTLLSAILRVRLGRDGVRALEVQPVIIDQRDGRPLPVAGAAARPVLERIYSLTDALAAPRTGGAEPASPPPASRESR